MWNFIPGVEVGVFFPEVITHSLTVVTGLFFGTGTCSFVMGRHVPVAVGNFLDHR